MKHIVHDLSFLTLSIVCAVLILTSGIVDSILTVSANAWVITSFVVGMFFTSVVTIAPAAVVLGQIVQEQSLWTVAIIGAAGAVCGDLLIFYLFRNHIARDVDVVLHHMKYNPLRLFVHRRTFRWLSILAGIAIIASPLPDELGVAVMGISKLDYKVFVPVSFIANFAGIILVGIAARAIA